MRPRPPCLRGKLILKLTISYWRCDRQKSGFGCVAQLPGQMGEFRVDRNSDNFGIKLAKLFGTITERFSIENRAVRDELMVANRSMHAYQWFQSGKQMCFRLRKKKSINHDHKVRAFPCRFFLVKLTSPMGKTSRPNISLCNRSVWDPWIHRWRRQCPRRTALLLKLEASVSNQRIFSLDEDCWKLPFTLDFAIVQIMALLVEFRFACSKTMVPWALQDINLQTCELLGYTPP